MKGDPTRTNQPVRWRDRGADAHALESRAALLVEAAAGSSPGEPVIDRDALARIHASVTSQRRRERSTGGAPPRPGRPAGAGGPGAHRVDRKRARRGLSLGGGTWRRRRSRPRANRSGPADGTDQATRCRGAGCKPCGGLGSAGGAAGHGRAADRASTARDCGPRTRRGADLGAGAKCPCRRSGSLRPGSAACRAARVGRRTDPAVAAGGRPTMFAATKDTEAHLLAQALSLLRQKTDRAPRSPRWIATRSASHMAFSKTKRCGRASRRRWRSRFARGAGVARRQGYLPRCAGRRLADRARRATRQCRSLRGRARRLRAGARRHAGPGRPGARPVRRSGVPASPRPGRACAAESRRVPPEVPARGVSRPTSSASSRAARAHAARNFFPSTATPRQARKRT